MPRLSRVLLSVYPRVGGGNAHIGGLNAVGAGLSPRGRGKLPIAYSKRGVERSIPAWAGETPPAAHRSSAVRVYPRVGGGNNILICDGIEIWGLSPRGRGKHAERAFASEAQGSIPAWAGETETPRGSAI